MRIMNLNAGFLLLSLAVHSSTQNGYQHRLQSRRDVSNSDQPVHLYCYYEYGVRSAACRSNLVSATYFRSFYDFDSEELATLRNTSLDHHCSELICVKDCLRDKPCSTTNGNNAGYRYMTFIEHLCSHHRGELAENQNCYFNYDFYRKFDYCQIYFFADCDAERMTNCMSSVMKLLAPACQPSAAQALKETIASLTAEGRCLSKDPFWQCHGAYKECRYTYEPYRVADVYGEPYAAEKTYELRLQLSHEQRCSNEGQTLACQKALIDGQCSSDKSGSHTNHHLRRYYDPTELQYNISCIDYFQEEEAVAPCYWNIDFQDGEVSNCGRYSTGSTFMTLEECLKTWRDRISCIGAVAEEVFDDGGFCKENLVRKFERFVFTEEGQRINCDIFKPM